MKHCIVYLSAPLISCDYALAYAKEFNKMGYSVDLINVESKENLIERVVKAIRPGTKFVLSMHGSGHDLMYEGMNLYDCFDIPFLYLCIDHVYINDTSILDYNRRFVYGLFDAEDERYIKEYCAAGCEYFFSPSAGLASGLPVKRMNERVYDVMFCGSVYDPDFIKGKIENYADSVYLKVFETAVEISLSDETETDFGSVQKALSACNISAEYFGSNIHNFLVNFLFYTRFYKRIRFLNGLTRNGIKIDCFGDEKELAALDNPNFIVHKYLSTPEYSDALNNSKIVLNTSPLIGFGATERLFSGMLNGAAVVTDTNAFVTSQFADGESMIAYSHRDYDALAEKIRLLSESPARLQDIADCGRKISEENHTFFHRARNIISVIEKEKIKQGE